MVSKARHLFWSWLISTDFFFHLWIDSKNHNEPWYLNKSKQDILDARLTKMKPPYDVTGTCRPLKDINLWKASEFRSFALYYFPALEDLLPEVYYKHFQSIAYVLEVLLQEKVPLALGNWVMLRYTPYGGE